MKIADSDQTKIDREIERRIRNASKTAWRPDYEKWVNTRVWSENHQKKALYYLMKYVGNERGTILEVGCGVGGLLVALELEGFKVIGLDYNHENCVITNLRGRRYERQVNVLNGSAETLPIKDNSIDVITCYEVLEHVFDPIAMLKEFARILRPEGKIFITVPNRWAFYDHHYQMYGINWTSRRTSDRIVKMFNRDKAGKASGVQKLSEMHYFTRRDFGELCHNTGFRLFDIREEVLLEDGLQSVNRYKRLAGIVRRLGVAEIAYKAYNRTFIGGWHFLLEMTP